VRHKQPLGTSWALWFIVVRASGLRYNRRSMSRHPEETASRPVEALHLLALATAALGLLLGLLARKTAWVEMGVSLILLLPPLRLATSIAGEARAHRYGVAAIGLVVLTFLLLSRRVS